MNNRSIEQYLRKMIQIDQEALSIEGRIKEEELAREKALRKAKRTMEMDILKRARMEAKREMDAQLSEAREAEEAVQAQTDEELERLKAAYEAVEDQMVQSTVQALLAVAQGKG